MEKQIILAVDDEPDILELIQYNLEKEGYRVVTAVSGEEAVQKAGQLEPDLVLLDWMLPGMDGLSVCRLLKQNEKTRSIPVIMVTARGDDTDIVTGLELGADDYIPKPFSPRVLIARVRTVLRRPRPDVCENGDRILRVHGLTIDKTAHSVTAEGAEFDLSVTEFSILELFAGFPGRVFSRNQIIDAVKGRNYPVTERAVDMQILGLRRTLGEYGDIIETVRGIGYRMRR